MRLGEEPRATGLKLDPGENGLARRAQLSGEQLADRGGRKRRGSVTDPGELPAIALREQVRSRGEVTSGGSENRT